MSAETKEHTSVRGPYKKRGDAPTVDADQTSYTPGNTGERIMVGCKLPTGLHLDLFGDVGTETKRISIRGSNAAQVIGGYGITRNVDKAFFDEWMKRNKHMPYVKNGLIFEHKEMASVRSIAKEQAEIRSNLEPLNPDKPMDKIEPTESLQKQKRESRSDFGKDRDIED